MIPKLKDLKYGDKNISRVLLEDKVIWSREPAHTYEVIYQSSTGIKKSFAETIVKSVKVSFSRDLRTCKRIEIDQKYSLGTLTFMYVFTEESYKGGPPKENGKFIFENFQPKCEIQGDYIIWHMLIDVYIHGKEKPGRIVFYIKIKK